MTFQDKLTVEHVEGGEAFDLFTTFGSTVDMTQPSSASFELGEELTYPSILEKLEFGATYATFLNDRPLIRGRLEAREVSDDAGGGAATRFTIRTKLTDAHYASAPPNLKAKNISIKELVLRLYEELGYTESDFIFEADVARNVMTGKERGGGPPPPNFAALREDQWKINPPETVFQVADKHLRRFGLMHWDGPDGRIVVGYPDDEQEPRYSIRRITGPEGAYNNVLSLQLHQDMSDVPTHVGVFATAQAAGFAKARFIGTAEQEDLREAGFNRPVIILAGDLKSNEAAEDAAKRELASRIRGLGSLEAKFDYLSFPDIEGPVNFSVNSVVDVVSDAIGIASGAYLITAFDLSRSPSDGDSATIKMVKRGLWRIR